MQLLTSRVVVDPIVWEILLLILVAAIASGLLYYIYIHIAYRMAINRHRDPLGWVLLSLFCSPLFAWIILLIVGDNKTYSDTK